MAPTWLDKNVHPNTQEETEKILNKLRTRKINCRTGDELTKFFAKLNAENVHKASKNVKNSPGTPGDHQVTYGPISSIPPGTWWGIRMDLSRDRVHTPLDSPIDSSSLGAISICTPHSNPQNDLDQGDYLTFTSPSPTPTPSTHPLVLSCQNNFPIRLIRGYNLRNPFSPKTGYRYDGLYLIITFWLIESPTSSTNLRFALARIDQGPPPWTSPLPELHSPLKKTRNASKMTQRCQLDCCKPSKPPKTTMSDLNNSPITPQTKQLDKKQESTIVMRRVSKKCESLNGGESPKLNNPPKSTFKLQNTNISIRTDLYDSSPNPQDIKKTPMTFCRVYNSSKSQVKPVQSTSAGILNLNTFGPGAKDKIQESQIQMRSGGKISSPVVEVSSRKDNGIIGDSESPSEGSNGLVHDFMRIDLKDGDKIVGMMKKMSYRVSEGSDGSPSPLEIEVYGGEKDKTTGESLIKGIIEDSEVIRSEKPEKCKKIIANESIPQTKTPKSSKLDKKISNKTLYSLRSSSPKKETCEGKNVIKKSIIKQQKGMDNSSHENISKNLKKQTKSKVESFSNSSKKRQSELAKLEIDGNFVTKIRGPRTRRFPYAMRGFSKRRDNLRYLKGRTKPDISKKTKLIKRNNTNEVKSSRILKNRPLTTKSSSNQNIEPKNSIIPEKKSLEPKKLEKSTQKSEIKKSKMVDKSVQCILQRDASTSVDPDDMNHSKNHKRVRNNWVNTEEIKSEDEESDDDLQEIIYRDCSVQTQKAEILRPNFVKSLETSGRFGSGNSAFVPVNVSDVDFRVARLRSIGFKPIDPCVYETSAFSEYRQGSKAPVVRRDVGEQYEKYTSEENDIVGYMDDELRYQDIEEERGVKRGIGGVLRKRKKSEEGEEPWLGWKKFTHL